MFQTGPVVLDPSKLCSVWMYTFMSILFITWYQIVVGGRTELMVLFDVMHNNITEFQTLQCSLINIC